MSMKSNIIDGLGRKNSLEVSNNNAAKVATLQYYNYTNEVRYFLNPDYGFNMTINSSSNLDELVNNGGDTVAWTGVNVSGTPLVFNNTTNPYAGTYHISGTTLVNNTTFRIERGSTTGTVDFVSLTGYFNLVSLGNPTAELYITGYNTLTGLPVGNEVSVFDYINTANTNVYQPFTIPLLQMGLEDESIDSFRFRCALPTDTMTFYIDNVYLTSLGTGVGTQTFTLEPNRGETLIVETLNWLIVDNYDGVTGQNGTPKLEWDKILGETLANGVNFQQYKGDKILFSINLRRIISWLSIPNIEIKNYASDGTNTMINIVYNFSEPFVMEKNDKIIGITNDNMTGFQTFRVSANCKSLLGSTGNKDQFNTGHTMYSYGS